MKTKRKPLYKRTEEWESEVPELTVEQENNVEDILKGLGRNLFWNPHEPLNLIEYPVVVGNRKFT